ncbi:rRNA pseudouridine synthase [Candidatus Dependentiae bacterium]|nr:MAG: rRNA pseudouridine synthase [Candidatus Dependentiae bacterium]
MDTMQLNKYLAHAGVCSRRNAVELIKKGLVRVNGVIVKEPAYVVKETDKVTVQGKRVILEKPVYVLLNKPKGYITAASDPTGKPTVMALLGKHVPQRIYPVGRLDQTTTGLLLLTNDGELAQRLAHPRYEIQKEYVVLLDRAFSERDRKHIMRGVRLRDGMVKIAKIFPFVGAKENQVRLVLHSGKYRVVRRVFEQLGYRVKALDRVKYAGLTKRGLPVGGWRVLTSRDVVKLKRIAKLET